MVPNKSPGFRAAGLLSSLLLIGVLSISSCSLVGIEEYPGTTSPIEGRVFFSVYEGFASYDREQEPVVLLKMLTEKIYGCCNFAIVADVKVLPGMISVDLQGINKPPVCLTALGPASYDHQIDVAPGTYALVIKSNQGTDIHALVVTSDYIQVRPGSSLVSSPQATLVWRVPERSFAYICGTTIETAWMCSDFADSLMTLPGLSEFDFPDSGFIPYWPPNSDGYWHNEPARYFKYYAEADFDSAGALLTRYKRDIIQDQQGIGLSLINWRNKWYRSWMMP